MLLVYAWAQIWAIACFYDGQNVCKQFQKQFYIFILENVGVFSCFAVVFMLNNCNPDDIRSLFCDKLGIHQKTKNTKLPRK